MFLEQLLLFFPLILGAYITFSLLKLPDLSIESAYLFGGITGSLAMKTLSVDFHVALLIAFAAGAMVGAMTSLQHTYFGVPFLLGSIFVFGVVQAFSQFLLPEGLASLHDVTLAYEKEHLIVVDLLVAGMFFLLFRLKLGLSWKTYGSNPSFFTSHGMSNQRVINSGVILGSSLAGVSGFFFAIQNRYVDLTMASGLVLFCVTAIVLGRAVYQTSKGNIFVPFIGLLICAFVQYFLIKLGISLRYFLGLQALMTFWVFMASMKRNTGSFMKLEGEHLGV